MNKESIFLGSFFNKSNTGLLPHIKKSLLILLFSCLLFITSCIITPQQSKQNSFFKISSQKSVNSDLSIKESGLTANSKSPEEVKRTSQKAALTENLISNRNKKNSILNQEDISEPLEKEVTITPSEIKSKESSSEKISGNIKDTLATERHGLIGFPEVKFELELIETRAFKKYFQFYSKQRRRTFIKWLKRAEPYIPYIYQVFKEKGLPFDLVFLPFAESGFNSFAYSRAGAAGIWQFMPSTAKKYGLRVDWWVDERRDPYKSTVAAANYLLDLYRMFNDWYLALAAYNAGEGKILKAIKRTGKENFFELSKRKRYLYRETRYYVPKFMAILKIIRNLKKLGFPSIKYDPSRMPSSIKVSGKINLIEFCQKMRFRWKLFKKLNPAFRRYITPPDSTSVIYIPSYMVADAKKIIQKLKKLEKKRYASRGGYYRYIVKKGDSWWKISCNYSIPISILKRINSISSNRLKPGQVLLIPKSQNNYFSKFVYNNRGYIKYKVKFNDTLWDIAHKFGLSVYDLRKANRIFGISIIKPGQTLIIPLNALAKKRLIAKKRANYTVKKGDSLWSIAKKFGVSIETLKEANGLTSNYIQVGDNLYIPFASVMAPKRILYKVRRGDSIWKIAERFGVSAKEIISWNNLKEDGILYPGSLLRIYVK